MRNCLTSEWQQKSGENEQPLKTGVEINEVQKALIISMSNTMDKFVLFQYVRVGQRYSRHQSRTRKHWKGNGQF